MHFTRNNNVNTLFLIQKSRDLVSRNLGIWGLKNGPGSRDPGIATIDERSKAVHGVEWIKLNQICGGQRSSMAAPKFLLFFNNLFVSFRWPTCCFVSKLESPRCQIFALFDTRLKKQKLGVTLYRKLENVVIAMCYNLRSSNVALVVLRLNCEVHTKLEVRKPIRVWLIAFLPRCIECRRDLAMRILSVCLSVRASVCPSVCLSNAWIVTKRKKNQCRFLYHTKDHLA